MLPGWKTSLFPPSHVGLAMATAISAWLNVAMLCGGLIRRGHFSFDLRVLWRVAKYLLASIVMGGVIWGMSDNVSTMISGGMTEKITGLLILVASGVGSYLAVTFITGAVKIQELKALLSRKKAG